MNYGVSATVILTIAAVVIALLVIRLFPRFESFMQQYSIACREEDRTDGREKKHWQKKKKGLIRDFLFGVTK